MLVVAGGRHTIDLAAHPITTAAEVREGLDTGLLVQVPMDGPVRMVAPVIGGS